MSIWSLNNYTMRMKTRVLGFLGFLAPKGGYKRFDYFFVFIPINGFSSFSELPTELHFYPIKTGLNALDDTLHIRITKQA